MKTGKLTDEALRRIVLERLPSCSGNVSEGPGTGLDCGVIRSTGSLTAVSSDPITGATSDIGKIAVHVSCNDIACCGIRPSAITLVVIAPVDSTEQELIRIIDQISAAARDAGVDIAGGHTEISPAVNRFVLVTTAFGYSDEGRIIYSSGAECGDSILMTKYAGLEGSAIMASDFRVRLEGRMSEEDIVLASGFSDQLSVVAEGVLCGGMGVHAMHDATEGGILGAAWELAAAGGKGCIIDLRRIPVMPQTARICELLGLDPFRLISSGSMLISTDKPDAIIGRLLEAGILCTEIGKIVEKDREFIDLNGQIHELLPAGADELYKIQ
ncbi:MAG: AIR synthase family protein [Saccharofermentanales bacterium]